MDPILLSRLQFALTTIYHWLFVPLTLGLGWFVAFMQTRYYQTKDETWHKMTKFWGKLFLINFAIGVVTGIVQEFQFGMNWSEYSRYVGDIFGAPLAIEALLASFLILAVSGYHIFRKQNLDFFKRCFTIASVVGLIASVLVFLGGHTMGQYMYETQPMKFASIEAHWETSKPAAFSILTIGDLTGKREVWSIRVPRVLSFLACNNFNCEVKGVNELQQEEAQKFGHLLLHS